MYFSTEIGENQRDVIATLMYKNETTQFCLTKAVTDLVRFYFRFEAKFHLQLIFK
jgi:hypothetical protein